MSPDPMTAIFTATDEDGDVLSVEYHPVYGYVFTASGEDGHRSAVLDAEKVRALVTSMTHHLDTLDRVTEALKEEA